jgi:ferredoxin-NADP reductase
MDGTPLPGWLAGQSITVKLQPGNGAGALVRNYSLSNRPGSGTYRISVKRETHGAASNFIASGVQVGDTVDVAAPRGTFSLADGAAPVVLVSAGVGVTPVLSMLHQLAARQPEREVWWLHGARRHIAYTRPGPSDRQGTDL